jgi:CRISPR-associated endonuclease/helicase Cas3
MSTGSPVPAWFETLTGHATPHEWQKELMEEESCRDRLIRIPTGLGKTEGALAAWSLHRICNRDERWPRRLVWCLPMRVLVEQTEQTARALAARIPAAIRPDVYVAMGGEDAGDWFLYPERPAILVGTQDMLLSRALNRGYGSGRARWPVEFGLLNQDALWVMDEVQLMDVGLATSAQLQAFREEDRGKSLRPCHTWWMSATLQPEWLKSVDTADYHAKWTEQPCQTRPEQRTGPLWAGVKRLEVVPIEQGDAAGFAEKILAEHALTQAGAYGRITLVVCNTVERARLTFEALRAAGATGQLQLIHSRFRQAEREHWRDSFLSKAACTPEADRIIVSTQVVEAGVDISATALITELAPWSSLVQRFGRCARFGGDGRVTVVDRGQGEETAAPYAWEELERAREALGSLQEVGIARLEAHEAELTADARERLYPYSPEHLLMRREFDELFDTTPDLTGGDLDISRFIRTGDERDLHVFWLDLEKTATPDAKRQPGRRELCAVPFLKARDWLCGKEKKSDRKARLRGGMRAWVWDWLAGEWKKADRATLTPGRIVCVAADCGGYSTERGFDPNSPDEVSRTPSPAVSEATAALEESDNRQDAEGLSVHAWKTIGAHAAEVATAAGELARALGLCGELEESLQIAGRWHDVGKTHGAFQGAIGGPDRPPRNDLAKAPKQAWLRPRGTYRFAGGEFRPAFRHELASALALFAVLEAYAPRHAALLGPWAGALSQLGHAIPEGREAPAGCAPVKEILECTSARFDLVAYLVASHHGKVRVALHAAPKDQDYRDRDGHGMPIRGVREADRLPPLGAAAGGADWPGFELTLEPAAMGLSARTGASWRDRVAGLLARYGPSGLGYLEALLRAADVRASRLDTGDPALTEVESA